MTYHLSIDQLGDFFSAEGPFKIAAYGLIGKNVDRTDTSYTICTVAENGLKNI